MVGFNNQIIRVCCSIGHMVVNTVRLAASQSSKISRPIFFWFQTVCSCKTEVTVEKNLSRRSRYDLVQLEGNSRSSTSLKKTEVGSINLWDKLQFVNSMKRLAFDSTKISFIKRLNQYISFNRWSSQWTEFFTESNLANPAVDPKMSCYIHC